MFEEILIIIKSFGTTTPVKNINSLIPGKEKGCSRKFGGAVCNNSFHTNDRVQENGGGGGLS